MNEKWMRGALTLAIVAGAARGGACGGSRQQEIVAAGDGAKTQLTSLRNGRMT